ncbi:formate dehydrogenase subunit alpha [Magnetovibrio sp.]|uniref:formate dehydrogenase subunit alpha n=1 Tax=Magnetovibrio sp. TaxID=2024836 RepID=UPI002F959179
MLIKKKNGSASAPRLKQALSKSMGGAVDRRAFLKGSGLAAGGVALAGALPLGAVQKAKAAEPMGDAKGETKSSVCTHCSVGCGIKAEVKNGVWTRQEPDFDSPFNLGGHCAKGASVREHAHNERRLRYPMKLEGGKWKRISWETAIDEIGDKMLEVRQQSGPDSVYWLGSAKFSNEQAYLFRKFYAFWGSNNGDHQARICHSTTVAGVANTWGYGAMTNSFNDMHNAKSLFLIGSNPAEAHPVAVQHILKAKEENNAPLIVCDPRFTRTAAHADEFVRMRPGTDVALIWGILWHIFDNGWEDKQFIEQRVWGLDRVRKEIEQWTPEETERVTGVPGAQLKRVAGLLAKNRPGTVVWCMGGTQHHNGNNNTRAYCILQLALGNMGKAGGGTNIFRGHDNVQGATDMCVLSHSLPGYYGLAAGAWKHWSRVWDVDYDWMVSRFASEKLMQSAGIPVSRWIDGVLENKDNIDQPDNLRVMVLWGHAVNSQTRLPDMKKAMEKLDTMVVIDPVPTFASVIPDRTDGVYVLPACTQFETYGSVTASNRSLQWREKVVDPLYESLPDHTIMAKFAKKLGFADQFFKNIKLNGDEPVVEDITREFNKGMWTIGYTGQSPERLKKQLQYKHTFDKTSLKAVGGPCDGEYYGLPWPCWGDDKLGHPGTPILYDPSMSVAEGGLTFRARYGVEHEGENLLAEGSYSKGSELKDGYPEFTMAMLKKLGWDKDLTAEERASIEKVAGDKTNWKTDLSGGIQRVAIKHGCAPFGNAKARTYVWTFPDPTPLHREPLYTARRDLLPKYATYKDTRAYRLPTLYESIQKNDHSKNFPTILTTGRLVEYEGGGDEGRSNKWLAELQQDMFCEVNLKDANDAGIRDGADMWVHSPEGGKVLVKAMVTDRVAPGVVFMPFHFGGWWQGKDLRDKYPSGTDPYVLGEASNMCGTYGYDSVTQMQETKSTLCRIEAA